MVKRGFKCPHKRLLDESVADGSRKKLCAGDDDEAALIDEEARLDREISQLENEGLNRDRLQLHIEQLHLYNEIKDAAQIAFGRLAEIQAVSLREIHDKYAAPTE